MYKIPYIWSMGFRALRIMYVIAMLTRQNRGPAAVSLKVSWMELRPASSPYPPMDSF